MSAQNKSLSAPLPVTPNINSDERHYGKDRAMDAETQKRSCVFFRRTCCTFTCTFNPQWSTWTCTGNTTSYLHIKEGYILYTCLNRLNRLRGNSDSHSRPTVGRCLRSHWSAVDKLIRVTSNNKKKDGHLKVWFMWMVLKNGSLFTHFKVWTFLSLVVKMSACKLVNI